MPILRAEFDLSETQMGTLASLLPGGILLGSLVFGPLVDKYSYRNLLVISVLLTVVGFELLAFSGSYFFLLLAFFVMGLGSGFLNGASNSAISDISEDFKENKGANLSIMGVFYGLGALGMPVLLGLLSDVFDQRTILGGMGISLVIPAIYMGMIKYPSPKHTEKMTLGGIRSLAGNSVLLLLSMVLFFQSGWESLINNWLTTYLIDVNGFPQKEALYHLTLFAVFFTLARLVMGFVLKRHEAAKVMSLMVLVGILGGFLLTFSENQTVLILSIAFLAFGLASSFPVILGIIGDKFARRSGTAFGVALTIALTGNIIINYGFGIIGKVIDFTAFPLILGGIGILTFIFLIISIKKTN